MTRPRPPTGARLADRLAGRLEGRTGARLEPDRTSLEPEHQDSGVESGPEAIAALSQAATPEAVLAAAAGSEARDLPPPIRDLVERIRSEVDRWERTTQPRRRPVPRAARRADAVPGGPEASPPSDPGLDRRMDRLVHRLIHLVHLAEIDRHQYEARRKVRMAEATPDAVQEASAQGPGRAAEGSPPDLGALGRQVLEAVTRILESRQQRRQEEPDVRDVWW